MVMDQCKGSVLSSGDVKLQSVTHPIPIRQASPLRLDPSIQVALASYIPTSILNKMGDFATTWSRGRKTSGMSAKQWASDLRTISTIFTCLAVEGEGGNDSESSAERDLELYDSLFKSMQKVGVVEGEAEREKGRHLIKLNSIMFLSSVSIPTMEL